MHEPNDPTLNDRGHPPERGAPVEVVIGRIIDGEATKEDRARFESLAAADPNLWRLLALRQQDMLTLADRVEVELDKAERVQLPAPAPAGARSLRHVWAYSGWAAMIALALVWAFVGNDSASNGRLSDPEARPATNLPSLSPEDHLQAYMDAPYVQGEMAPTLLSVEQMSDGRYAARILRRIEEVLFLEAPEDLPVDSNQHLTRPLHELRPKDETAEQSQPDDH